MDTLIAMKRKLEELATGSGTIWTYSEVVAAVYHAVKDRPFEAGVVHLQAVLSRSALVSIQHAAEFVVRDTEPGIESFGVGHITPEAAVSIDKIERVPMEFVRHVSSSLIPAPNI